MFIMMDHMTMNNQEPENERINWNTGNAEVDDLLNSMDDFLDEVENAMDDQNERE